MMNNFTLDELHQILDWAMKEQQCCGASTDEELMKKVEKMIDDYCE